MHKNNTPSLALLPTQMTTPSFIIDDGEYESPIEMPKNPTTDQIILLEEVLNTLDSPVLVPSNALDANKLFTSPVPETPGHKFPHDQRTTDLVKGLLFEAPWQKGPIDDLRPPHWRVYSSRIGTANEGIWRRFIDVVLVDEVTISTLGSGEIEFYEYGSAPYTKIPTLSAVALGSGASIFLRLPDIHRLVQDPEPEEFKVSHYYFGYAAYFPTFGCDMSSSTSLFRLAIDESGPRNKIPQCPTCCKRTCRSKHSCTCGCACERKWSFSLQEAALHRGTPIVNGKDGKCTANLSTKFTTLATGYACSDGVAIVFNYKPSIGEAEYQLDPAIRTREMVVLKWVAVELRGLFKASFTVRTPETTPLLERKNPFKRQVVVNGLSASRS